MFNGQISLILLFNIFVLFELTSCAPFTNVRMESVKKQPTFLELLAKPQKYKGQEVWLGGTVAALNKKGQKTLMEVIELPLDDNGRPQIDYPSGGKFIAEVSQQIDPDLFTIGTPLTMIGNVMGKAPGLLPEGGILLPLIRVKRIMPWKEKMSYGKNSSNWFDQPEGNLHAWGWGPGLYWW
ncbi:Slp family lipoprotein [Methylacidiphilum caldifontis]|uniref:Slp family lipoprotein n=1 Tax=Methylacidiphilum caldifontis TaxID=2795386 RepID=UPI001A8CE2EC|nr:Slp family lipoprotein [Methylacidiphilum caldifontis]QSR88429.1 Slp family lipoprotein [Methylacidiphilum caldifontis]